MPVWAHDRKDYSSLAHRYRIVSWDLSRAGLEDARKELLRRFALATLQLDGHSAAHVHNLVTLAARALEVTSAAIGAAGAWSVALSVLTSQT